MSEVEALCQLMVRYGLTELTSGAVKLVRPERLAFVEASTRDTESPPRDDTMDDEPDVLRELLAASPDRQDAVLMLRKLETGT